jgi:signal transduction histidine kinase
MTVQTILEWFSGGEFQYMKLYQCMRRDWLVIGLTIGLDVAVAAGYAMIAMHWWRNEKRLADGPAKRALGTMRNIFIFCAICGYVFLPIKMFWPAWRLYDIFLAALVFYTWRYAWGARDLKVIYTELGGVAQLREDLEKSREEGRRRSFFLNAVSHDLKTPLNAITLQAQLLQVASKAGEPAVVQESVDEIRRHAKATAQLLDELLEYARLDWSGGEPQALETVELRAVVQAVLSAHAPVAEQRGLYLKSVVPADLTLRSDRLKLERVLGNLVGNAVKFTRTGGVRVDVETSRDAVELHVIDTGVGIGAEHVARLFEEFYQANNPARDRSQGFGLGLAIARRLARQLGGDVTVTSTLGAGSRFTIVLPRTEPVTAPAAATPAAMANAAGA